MVSCWGRVKHDRIRCSGHRPTTDTTTLTPMHRTSERTTPHRAANALCLAALLLFTGTVYAQPPAPEIRIEGGPAALRDNIRAHLGIAGERCDAPLRRLERLRPQVERNVRRAAQALGYYRLRQTVAFSREESCWALDITAEPGEPVTVSAVDVRIPGELRALFTDLLESPPVRAGDQLNHGAYERFKTGLMTIAIDNGHFDARFEESRIEVDAQANSARLLIDLDPGERYRFGAVSIGEIDALSPDFIERFIPFEAGAPYSAEQLARLRGNLNDSQYFRRVEVTPRVERGTDRQVPIAVSLTPRLRRSYTAGAGISTDAGPRLRLAYEDRYINRAGHRLDADMTLSTQQQQPGIGYTIPLRDPATESLRFSGGFQREDAETYTTRTYRVGVTYRRNVWNNWVQNIFTNFQHERATLATGRDQTNTMVTGVNWARTRSDDPIYPRNGWRLFAEISGAHEAVLSDLSFLQLYGNAKYIRPLGSSRLLLRAEAATTAVDEATDLPVSERFFTGGDQSVRGYEWNTLGARSVAGDVVGGRNLLVGSVEFDLPVYNNWHAAVFYDVGNSFDDANDIRLRDAAGVGIRWLSPIGAIRADIARALDGSGFRFHLTMGPDL